MDECDLELPVFEPNENKLRSLAVRLQQIFGLELFGIDVIIENVTGRYAIIDINTFPGNSFTGCHVFLALISQHRWELTR